MSKTALLLLLTALPFPAAAQSPSKKLIISPGLTAAISLAPGNTAVKVLMPGADTMDFDLSTPPTALHSIKTADYNFDGLKDFAVTAAPAAGSTPTLFDIFLYNPSEKTFVALELPAGGACDAFANVKLSPADKTLRAACANEAPVRKLQTDVYKFTDPFTLEFDKTLGTVEEAAPKARRGADDEDDEEKPARRSRKSEGDEDE